MNDLIKTEDKVWGTVTHLFERDVHVSVLNVIEGFRCSRHYHEKRWNCFRVITGIIDVVVYKGLRFDSTEEMFRRRLVAGASYDVAPGLIHRFEVIRSGKVVELYWTVGQGSPQIDDIVRFDQGGPIDG